MATQTIRCSGMRPAEASSALTWGYGPPGLGPVPWVRSTQRSTRKTPSALWPHMVITIPATGPPEGHQFGTVADRLDV